MSSHSPGLDSAQSQLLSRIGQALDAGRADEAARLLPALLQRHPGHPEVQRMQAGLLGLQGQVQPAIALMREVVRQHPGHAPARNTLATLLGQAGDFDAAINMLREVCRLQPDMALAWYNLGVMLTRSVRNEEASAALQEAVRIDPRAVDARALLADLLRMRGRSAEAAEAYRQVLAGSPWAGMAWWGLADLKTEPMAESDIRELQQALRSPRASDDDRIAMGFALARALDDHGRYAESLQALEHANAIARQRRQWNAAGYSQAADALAAFFDPQPAGATDPQLGEEVIFIVGLPRSGSTLAEQILASHPQVEGSGELPDLPQVLAEESRRRGQPFPRWVPQMQPADWQRLGERYLERTAHWRRDRPRFTDKLPSNWVYGDAIRAMLPGARIVGCRRDPLETCFSCYRQKLDNNEYTRSFDDLASFWRDCDRHLQRLARAYPGQVYLHDYEALLAEPEARIRELLAFCGLTFDPACLRFHENTRAVRSPSAMQVRQPLRGDTRHSARYGALLDPLRLALGLPRWQDGTPA
ncbi:MAG TPA: sulfotransferase [Dyella sp.]|nr:sulfotransferase [Dyella sp.]